MSTNPSVDGALAQFPCSVTLSGDQAVELRVVGPADREAILEFARSLPENDLLFLRVDITQEGPVDNWLGNVAEGVTVSIVAYHDGAMVGYATVDRNPAQWTRRVGEIRVNVGPALRGQGLGRQLTAKIFDVAKALGLKKLTAQMTADQKSAQAAFSRLGFTAEALLADYVEDRAGHARDLVIMSYDVDGLTDQMDDPLRV